MVITCKSQGLGLEYPDQPSIASTSNDFEPQRRFISNILSPKQDIEEVKYITLTPDAGIGPHVQRVVG